MKPILLLTIASLCHVPSAKAGDAVPPVALSDWEIRTGTSQAAQRARGERQAAERAAVEREARARQQATVDARDPERAAARRAGEAWDKAFAAYKAAPDGVLKEEAWSALSAADAERSRTMDAWGRSIAYREEQEQKRDRAEQRARISQLESEVASAQWQAQQAAAAAQQAQRQAAAVAAEQEYRQRQLDNQKSR